MAAARQPQDASTNDIRFHKVLDWGCCQFLHLSCEGHTAALQKPCSRLAFCHKAATRLLQNIQQPHKFAQLPHCSPVAAV